MMRENEPFTARHPVWFKISAYGILLYLTTLVMVFFLSFAFGRLIPAIEQQENWRLYTFAIAITALPLSLFAYAIARHIVWTKNGRDAALLGGGWAAVQLVMNLLIAIPNGNAAMIFTNPSTYLIYLAVFAGAMASRIHRD